MTKSDLVDVVSNKAGLPKAKVLDAIDALTDAIQGALKKGGQIKKPGFEKDILAGAASHGGHVHKGHGVPIVPAVGVHARGDRHVKLA